MNRSKKYVLTGVIAFFGGVILTAVIGIAMMKGFGNYAIVDSDEYEIMEEFYGEYKDLCVVDEAIDTYYYKDTSDIKTCDAACKAVVSELGDKYSGYMNADEYDNFKATATGEYSGVGITFAQDEDGNYVIVGITEGSPADRSELEAGDYILKVDGKSYKDQDVMAANIRGNEGTAVEITYQHDSAVKKVKLTREKIKVKSVTWKTLDDNTGYIAIDQFINNTADDFEKALKQLEKKGCDSLVLDLRNNGGGLVSEAVNIADIFIDSGVITYTEDRNGSKQEYKADGEKDDIKMSVLVNENSASSSEILAGALKDNGYKIVGEKTFGKGIIQQTMELDDGSAVKLTVAQYFTPDGHKVHKKGISPNVEVKNSSSGDRQLDKARSILN